MFYLRSASAACTLKLHVNHYQNFIILFLPMKHLGLAAYFLHFQRTSMKHSQKQLFVRCSLKFLNTHRKTSLLESLFKRPAVLKEATTLVFSCQFWEMFKNTFFNRTSLVAASVQISSSDACYFLECLQVSLLILCKFKRTNVLLFSRGIEVN